MPNFKNRLSTYVEVPLDVDELSKIKTGRVDAGEAIAALLVERDEGR